MVDKWFVNHTRRISKRGAILKSKSHSFYWPGTTSKGSRIVRVPYSLNTGFFSKLFGKRKNTCTRQIIFNSSSFIFLNQDYAIARERVQYITVYSSEKVGARWPNG